jgi:hypothetical protein
MSSRVALLVTGLWLGLLFASWVAASVNFRTVDTVLGPSGSPEVARRFEPVHPDERRMLLRHLASEINRWMFRWWSLTQLLLGIVLVAGLWKSGGAPRALAVTVLAVSIVQAAAFAGPITDLGRSIDFVPRPLPPDLGRRFGMLHAAYVILDLGKGALLAFVAAFLVRRG